MQKNQSLEISYHPHSFADPSIRVFQWNGDLYRGINGEKAQYFTKLFQAGIINALNERDLLIDSELTDLPIDHYDLIVQHRVIPFVSYPIEWCAAMLKQAALTLIDLAIELADHHLTLGDGHPWNLLVYPENCRPVFVDLGSIMPLQQSEWVAYDEFCRFCLYPLILMADGQALLARLLMFEDQGVLKSELIRLTAGRARAVLQRKRSTLRYLQSKAWKYLPNSWREGIKKALERDSAVSESTNNMTLLTEVRQKAYLEFLRNVKREIEAVAVPKFQPTSTDESEAIDAKLHQILSELQPASVLDVGCQTGRYSKLAARLGSQVIAFDTDEACITQLYYTAQAQKLPILPLIMDFMKPTPARGLADCWAIAATKRFQCDLVLAVGVLHRFVIEKRLNFDQIVEGFSLFSKRYVLVEFVLANDPEIANYSMPYKYSWYTVDNFIRAAKDKFSRVDILRFDLETRILLLCQK